MNKYKLRAISPAIIDLELNSIGFDRNHLNLAVDKYRHNLIKIYSLKAPAANILKQISLSKGADLAVASGVINCSIEFSDAILTATNKQLKQIIESIKIQPFGLKKLAEDLETFLNKKYTNPFPLKIADKLFDWGNKTYMMGILNITPDSFSDGGKYMELSKALEAVEKMFQYGVDIIDIGGESTRPNSIAVDSETQINRVIPIIHEIKHQFPEIVLSIDTRKHDVAYKAIEAGVHIINDVSGLTYDTEMIKIVSDYQVPVVIMHSLSTPDSMQINPQYNDLVGEITNCLLNSIEKALDANVAPEKIIIDPGIGFGKTFEHNKEILNRIEEFKSLGFALMLGISRKKFIENILGESLFKRDTGTAALCSYLISKGVDILRIHNVELISDVIKVSDRIIRS